MLILLSGSAASGKSSVLRELLRRRPNNGAFDMDDLRPPDDVDASWWWDQLERLVLQAVAAEQAGLDFILAGWTGRDQVLTTAASASLDNIVAVLLDCSDPLRRERIQRRSDSGTWRTHTADEVASYLRAAQTMRSERPPGVTRIDTSELSIAEVADRVEELIRSRPTSD